MNRRDLLMTVASLTGYAVCGGEAWLAQARPQIRSPEAQSLIIRFDKKQQQLLDEIAETIIPNTDTPGAKAAKVGAFMEVMVRDCYTLAQQEAFMAGLRQFDVDCQAQAGRPFIKLTVRQRHDYLVSLERAAKQFNQAQQEREQQRRAQMESENKDNSFAMQKELEALPRHFYTMVKQLTLLGFFTSETGMTKTLRYVPVPGRYDGDVPYRRGQKAWA